MDPVSNRHFTGQPPSASFRSLKSHRVTGRLTMNASPHAEAFDEARLGQVVLVFQGGGALGAYQAGVYQALHEAGVEPDWIIGTSIGAINASLIAGNAPQ